VSIEHNRPRIHRATVTADVGMPVNPLTLESQFQGGIEFAVSQPVANRAITFSDARVDQALDLADAGARCDLSEGLNRLETT
jgi:CO/xanthine dehydrogenase Mo-binding subunit